ncbi:2-succinyl-5-enolpyruvyl-6-hydroxy-3-cyclohexene-1-carboxylic-acid synthase [Thalassotalea aquiviva]|uniref:2-succinyl-5-enolpyruvyl-6-hydroxy-3- cyclohexene-1-carboxylic-acid synthase n=1 Tax=Thalassotalea aquiviva TaxID=3242415 RepID=UPI00352B0BF7
MTLKTTANINLVSAQLIIEELFRHGIRHICIAPGSRSTPLTLAACLHPKIETYAHFDERGIGFYALGMIKALAQPVAVIVTSGTAVSNLHPAVDEANNSQLPLILLTADRPVELLDCGANQAITQSGLFANSICQQLDFDAPTPDLPPQYILTSIDKVLFQQSQSPGPIHINCRYKEPLYPGPKTQDFSQYLQPVKQWQGQQKPYSQYHQPTRQVTNETLDIKEIDHLKGIIIVGQQAIGQDLGDSIESLAKGLGWPVFYDVMANTPKGEQTIHYYDQLLHHQTFAELLQECECFIQLGHPLISTRLQQSISTSTAQYWLVAPGIKRFDPFHRVNQRFVCSPKVWLTNALTQINTLTTPAVTVSLWRQKLIEFEKKAKNYFQQLDAQLNVSTDLEPRSTPNSSATFNTGFANWGEYQVVRNLTQMLPKQSHLFIGNSMPIRLMDMFAPATSKNVHFHSNRGASGIDGLVATTAGIASQVRGQAVTLLIGDISLLHDLNSLALLSNMNSPVVIVVLNNDGGSIFNMLPAPKEHNIKSTFYQMPHGFTFAQAASMFRLNYYAPNSLLAFKNSYQDAITLNTASLIEVVCENDQSSQFCQHIKQQINNDFICAT